MRGIRENIQDRERRTNGPCHALFYARLHLDGDYEKVKRRWTEKRGSTRDTNTTATVSSAVCRYRRRSKAKYARPLRKFSRLFGNVLSSPREVLLTGFPEGRARSDVEAGDPTSTAKPRCHEESTSVMRHGVEKADAFVSSSGASNASRRQASSSG